MSSLARSRSALPSSVALNARPLILVVDDDPSAAAGVAESLRIAGFDVNEFTDPRAALTAALGRQPDAIVTDLKMPGWGGADLCLALRDSAWTDDVPLILMSGAEDAHALEDDGLVNRFLKKPVDPRTLAAAVESAIEETRIRRQRRV